MTCAIPHPGCIDPHGVRKIVFTAIDAIFFFNAPATTETYTLSLHDALPIWWFRRPGRGPWDAAPGPAAAPPDRKSTRLNSSHITISYAVFCLKKKKNHHIQDQQSRRPINDDGPRRPLPTLTYHVLTHHLQHR